MDQRQRTENITVHVQCDACGCTYRQTSSRYAVAEVLLGLRFGKCGACGEHRTRMMVEVSDGQPATDEEQPCEGNCCAD